MQLVILHHHLNPGGVTRVIENHLRALSVNGARFQPDRVLILHGGRAEGWPAESLIAEAPFELATATLPELDYQDVRRALPGPLPATIVATLKAERFPPAATILHWHNHSLGKNGDVPGAVVELARQGYRTLLQIHDFAEDFRPDNYRLLRDSLDAADSRALSAALYPQSSGIHYAALNTRDHEILKSIGVPASRLHRLPNPVAAPPRADDAAAARRLLLEKLDLPDDGPIVVYPVRGIRRKNVGELLLWSALHPQASFVLTLAPKNPTELASMERWRELAGRLGLNCRLGIPAEAGVTFGQTLTASNALITTSVAEGFGMTFLECWLAERRLLGRNLPEITEEFVRAGINLQELTDRVHVPGEWIDLDAAIGQLSELCQQAFESMGQPAPSLRHLSDHFRGIFALGIDFAQLPVELQFRLVQRVAQSAADRERLLHINPRLHIPDTTADSLVRENAAVVRRHYSIEALSDRLSSVYQAVGQSKPSTQIDAPAHGENVLRSFLDPGRLYPLRIEP